MINTNQVMILAVLVVAFQLLIFYRTTKYKKIIDKKNMQLMQFYLDAKFICKGFVDSFTISESNIFCKNLMEQIKEYYNLEELIVIGTSDIPNVHNNNLIRQSVIKFIESEVEPVSGHDIKKFNIKISSNDYVIYVSNISEYENNSLIIAVVESLSELSNNERIGFQNSINLLKTRLIN